MSLDSRAAFIAVEAKREILNIVKQQRCNLSPQAMHQLIKASAAIASKEDRNAFLQSAIKRAPLSSDRTIEVKSALDSISALIPSLQAANAVSASDLGALQAMTLLSSSSSSSSST